MVECNIQSAVIYVLEASIHFPQLKRNYFRYEDQRIFRTAISRLVAF